MTNNYSLSIPLYVHALESENGGEVLELPKSLNQWAKSHKEVIESIETLITLIEK